VGAIGSFICAALRSHEGPIIAMDVDPARLEVAAQLGATASHLISPTAGPQDLRALVPAGAQVVFETSGVLGAAERALALASKGGTVLLVGLNKTPQALNLADVVLREITIQTTVAHVCDSDLPAALSILSSHPMADVLPTRVIAIEDVVSGGLEPLVSGSARGKILVDPRHG
jgi:(R,R)-butanediol dehydrogenase/meso-butanediol dehydrogenase/diacetyl reductase